MEVLLVLARIGFYSVLLLTLGAAVLVVTARNIFHCALALILALLGIAATYVYLKAEFLAVIQILLYVGAIMTLVIFAIMLTHRIGDAAIPQANRQSVPAFLLLAAFNLFFTGAAARQPWRVGTGLTAPPVSTEALGTALMGEYVFPFEIISVVLIVALVGAIVLGRSDP
jgi:NADH-quinone oxidoreductase subunit J